MPAPVILRGEEYFGKRDYGEHRPGYALVVHGVPNQHRVGHFSRRSAVGAEHIKVDDVVVAHAGLGHKTSSFARNSGISSAKSARGSCRYVFPVSKGNVIYKFGSVSTASYGKCSDGIVIGVSGGSSVRSIADGVVIYVGYGVKSYGDIVIIEHSGGVVSSYSYLSKVLVKMDDKVRSGQKIAMAGKSSMSVKYKNGKEDSRPKLCFVVRKGGKSINPEIVTSCKR